MTKRKKKGSKKRNSSRKSESTIPPVPRSNGWFVNFIKKSWKIIGVVGLIISLILSIEPIRNLFLSSSEKYEKENFVEGDLKSPVVTPTTSPLEPPLNFTIKKFKFPVPNVKGIFVKHLNKKQILTIQINGYTVPLDINSLYKGINLGNEQIFGCSPAHVILAAKDSRLYISLEFEDLQNEQTIGSIEFNHWKLYKPNMFDFNSTDEKLEVRDKQSYIVLSLSYSNLLGGSVILNGYFLSPESIFILHNYPDRKIDDVGKPFCIPKTDPDWKQKAAVEIRKIKSIF